MHARSTTDEGWMGTSEEGLVARRLRLEAKHDETKCSLDLQVCMSATARFYNYTSKEVNVISFI